MKEKSIQVIGEVARGLQHGYVTRFRTPVTETFRWGDINGKPVSMQERANYYRVQDGRIYLNAKLAGPKCPLGVPGDRLWVKEAWSTDALTVYPCPPVWYKADFCSYDDPARLGLGCLEHSRTDRGDCFACWVENHGKFHWHSAYHMRRELSRCTVEVTDVKILRVQETTNADASALGVKYAAPHRGATCGRGDTGIDQCLISPYRDIWNDFYGASGFDYDSNPWVWDVTVRRVYR